MHRIKEYPSVGWCIYCGAPDWWCQIDDEHIVPSAFGVNHILRGASCHGCAGTTSYLTGYCSHVIFEPLIVHQRVPRKRRKKLGWQNELATDPAFRRFPPGGADGQDINSRAAG